MQASVGAHGTEPAHESIGARGAVKFRRKHRFTPELLSEAASTPGGHVYEIDPRFDRDGAIPGHAVKGAWVVDGAGRPTDTFQENPSYGMRVPLSDVDQIVADMKANSGLDQLEILVADSISIRGEPVPFDVGISVVMDGAFELGYFPEVEPWMTEIDGGRIYRMHRQVSAE